MATSSTVSVNGKAWSLEIWPTNLVDASWRGPSPAKHVFH
jgi:hypothetical protein